MAAGDIDVRLVVPVPKRPRREATIRRRRIGYTVRRSWGVSLMENPNSWHPTRKRARKAAKRWVDRDRREPGLLVERIKGPRA